MPDSLPYAILTQRNPQYKGKEWREITDLYEGGFAILDRADHYLPKMRQETAEQHEERKREASYIGYMGQIVDYFAANLFSQEITVTPAADADDPNTPGELPDKEYYSGLAKDCDRKGTTFAKLLRDSFTSAILKRKALVAIDFPRIEGQMLTRADEEASGAASAYLIPVAAEQLIDWDYDPEGNFKWVVLHRSYPIKNSPYEPRAKTREEFKVWLQDPETKRVVWEIYAIEYDPKDTPPGKDTPIPLVDSGVTSFTRVPIIELSVPTGLWIGNKIGPLAREHFRRRSTLNAAESRTLFEIPVVRLGSEVGAPGGEVPSDAQQNPNRGNIDVATQCLAKGMTVLGKDDSLEFVGPSGQAYGIVDGQLKDLKEEMFRIVHQLAAAVSMGSAALKRSGESKSEDRRAESVVLSAFGALVRDFAVKLYRHISEARGESVIWVPNGLDNYESDDRGEVLSEAVQIDAVAIPSETFKAQHKISVALRLCPNLPPDTQAQIRQEIVDGVKAEQERAEHMHAIEELAAQVPEQQTEEPRGRGKKEYPRAIRPSIARES